MNAQQSEARLPHVAEHHRRQQGSAWRLVRVSIIALVVGVLGTLAMIFVIGSTAPVGYKGSVTILLPAPSRDVWSMLIDIDSLPKRRPEIVSVERLPSTEQGLRQWKEHTDMGGYITFSTVEEVTGKYLVVRMTDSSFGMRGTWTYTLDEAGAATALTITEESETRNIFLRAVMTATGRDANLRSEADTLRNALLPSA